MSNIFVELTEKELKAIRLAVALANERLDTAEAAKHVSKTEMDAVNFATEIVNEGELAVGDYLSASVLETETDELWKKFWSQTEVDFSDWFENAQEHEPEGWPQFRDAGLKAFQEANS